MALIFSESFQTFWCYSTDFMNFAYLDFVLFSEAKMFFFCFQKIIQNDFTYWKISWKPSCNQKNWFQMNFDSKRCPLCKTQWYSHKLHNDWHFTTFEVKDSCNSTPKSYMCSVLSVDCWKFKKKVGKWNYKVFVKGGCVFYEAPCSAHGHMPHQHLGNIEVKSCCAPNWYLVPSHVPEI